MATVYLIELRLEQKEMLLFLDQNPNFKHSIMAVTDDAETGKKWPAPAEAAPKRTASKPRKQRARRGSKVLDTIIGTLEHGHADAAELKKALEKAGLSPSSLSTGLAILQKNGKVVRDSGEIAYGEGEGVSSRGFYMLVDAA